MKIIFVAREEVKPHVHFKINKLTISMKRGLTSIWLLCISFNLFSCKSNQVMTSNSSGESVAAKEASALLAISENELFANYYIREQKTAENIVEYNFYDKNHFKPQDVEENILGGYPSYFSIKVNLLENKIVSRYISTE